MTIDGYKSCRKIRQQVQSTDLNLLKKLNTYQIFPHRDNGPCTSQWILRSHVRDALGVILFFQKRLLTERSLYAYDTADRTATECWLECDQNPPFPSPFSRHSASIQSVTGHLGPRTTRPRTTRPVSPDYSDRVTGPLGPFDFTTWIILGLIWLLKMFIEDQQLM